MEPEIQKKLDEINDNLIRIRKAVGGFWYAFGIGLMRGLGSVIGVAIVIVIIGWLLNLLGIIPSLRTQVGQWKALLENLQRFR